MGLGLEMGGLGIFIEEETKQIPSFFAIFDGGEAEDDIEVIEPWNPL